MMRFRTLILGGLVLIPASGSILRAQTMSDMLEKGIFTEETVGDLDAAIKIYEQIVVEATKNRSYAAQAQYRVGMCYLKKGRKQEAVTAFRKLIDQFPKQKELVAQAHTRLSALGHPISGMVARRIREGQLPYGRISPDGSYFTYVDWSTGDLAVTDVGTGENRRLTDKGTWAESDEYAELSIVSPEGKQIAYAWFNGRFYEMRLVGFDGSDPRVLYSHEDVEYLWPGAWSPDGKYVTATLVKGDNTHELVLISVADGSGRVLKKVDWRWLNPGPFSPDGRYIVFGFAPSEESPQGDIFLLATDGSQEVPVVEHPGHENALAWTLDGESLLFTSDRTGNTDVWAIRIRDGEPQGDPQLVKPNIGRISPLGFTSEGDFYYGLTTSLRDAYVAPLDLVNGKGLGTLSRVSQRYVGSTLWPRWSHDGEYLIYLRRDSQRFRSSLAIVIRSLANGEERELRPELMLGQDLILRPSLSPNGESILLAAQDKRGRRGIYLVDTRTAAVTPVVRPESGTRAGLPAWSPDGKTVFYKLRNKTSKQSTIVAQDLATGRETNVYDARHPSKVVHFSVSHDGLKLAFLLMDQTSASTAIMVMPTEGGEPRTLLSAQDPEFIGQVTGVAWSPDGHNLLFRRGRKDTKQPGDLQRTPDPVELWRIPLAGGEPEKVGETMPGFLLGPHIHPDGKRIVFTTGGGKKELWVLENFLPALEAARGE